MAQPSGSQSDARKVPMGCKDLPMGWDAHTAQLDSHWHGCCPDLHFHHRSLGCALPLLEQHSLVLTAKNVRSECSSIC